MSRTAMRRVARWFLGSLMALPLVAAAPDLQSQAGIRVGVACTQRPGEEGDWAERHLAAVLRSDLGGAPGLHPLMTAPAGGDRRAALDAWREVGADWELVLGLLRNGQGARVKAAALDVRTGRTVFVKNYAGAWNPGTLRRIAHLVCDRLVEAATGTPGNAATRIVFCKDLGRGVKEIWQADADGTNLLPLTDHKSLTLSPTVAKDGRLAYLTYKGGAPEIWGQRVPGGPYVRLVAPDPAHPGQCFSPVWSPDGKRLAYVQVVDRRGDTDVMSLEFRTGRITRLTQGGCSNTEPAWSPSGKEIAFTSDREGASQIFLVSADGTHLRRITPAGQSQHSPAWSPSGRRIACISGAPGHSRLSLLQVKDASIVDIPMGVGAPESPAWAPDGRQLVFSVGGTAPYRLYTTDLSGREVRPFLEAQGCQSPRWLRWS